MKQYIESVTDELTGLPIGGAEVFVYDDDNNLAVLYAADTATEIDNPLTTNEDGEFSFYSPTTELTALVYFANRLRRRLRLLVGGGYSAASAASASVAEAFAGPTYDSTVEGLAATEIGDSFAVYAAGVTTVYLHEAGPVATEIRKTIAPATLAASGGAALVGFEQEGADAIATDVDAKIKELPVAVTDFYDPDDNDDYAPALGRALDAGHRILFFPEKSGGYDFLSPITKTLSGDTIIDFNGQTVRSDDAAVTLKGVLVTSAPTLAANITRYATSVELTDASLVQAGDLVVVATSIEPSTDWEDKKQDTVRVRSKSGNVLTLNEGFNFSYTTGDAGLDILVYRPVRLTIMRPKAELIAADTTTPGSPTAKVFECEGLAEVQVIEPSFKGQYPYTRAGNYYRNGIRFYYCHNITIQSPEYEAMGYGAGAYGGSRYITEYDVRARYCHHGHLDMGTWSSDYHLDGMFAADCYQGLSTHACFRANAVNFRCYNETGLSNWRVCGGSLRDGYIYTTVDDSESSQFQNNTPASGYEYINTDADLTISDFAIVAPNRTSTPATLEVKYGRVVSFSGITSPDGRIAADVALYINGPGNRFGASNVPSPNTILSTTTRYDSCAGRELTIASAGTIALPVGVDVVFISGTTNITTITATGHVGRVVTLVFFSSLTVVDGSNLALAGDFSATNGDCLTLACADGSAWYEISRSAN